MTHERRERKPRFGWLELFLAVAVVALAGQLGSLAWQTLQNRPRPGVQVARRFGATGYLLYLPREYRRQSSWPLLVYLHGAGERGTEPARLAEDCGPPGQIERGRDFSMIVVSPQCPPGRRFDATKVLAYGDPARYNWLLSQRRVPR